MATVVISDTFTAADATPVNGRTPSPTNTPGNTWVALLGGGGTGTIDIYSNKAYRVGVNDCFEQIQSGVADCTVSGTFRIDTTVTGFQGFLLFRSTSTANRNNCYIAGVDAATNHFTMYRYVAGTPTQVDQISFTVAADTDYFIEATLSGSSISVTVTGGSGPIVDSSGTHSTATIHGFALVGNVLANFNDFLVTTPSAGGASSRYYYDMAGAGNV